MQLKGQAPQAVAGWQREGSSASRLHQTLWLESILTLAENALFRPFRARQAELPPLNLCAAGICLTPVAAVANNLWQQQIAGITTLSPQRRGARSSPAAGSSSVVTAAQPRGQPPDARCRSCRWGGLPLSGAGDAGFLYQQPAPVRSVGDHLAVYHRLSGTPPTPKLQAQQRLRADSRLLDDWLRRGAAALSAWLYQGAADPSWKPLSMTGRRPAAASGH